MNSAIIGVIPPAGSEAGARPLRPARPLPSPPARAPNDSALVSAWSPRSPNGAANGNSLRLRLQNTLKNVLVDSDAKTSPPPPSGHMSRSARFLRRLSRAATLSAGLDLVEEESPPHLDPSPPPSPKNDSAAQTQGGQKPPAKHFRGNTLSKPYSPKFHALFDWAFVGIFGVLGVLMRYCITEVVLFMNSASIYGAFITMSINVSGSLLIGVLFYAYNLRTRTAAQSSTEAAIGLAMIAGLMGGFTTFSGYSLDVVKSFRSATSASTEAAARPYWLTGWANALLSPLLAIAACLAGIALAEWYFTCSKKDTATTATAAAAAKQVSHTQSAENAQVKAPSQADAVEIVTKVSVPTSPPLELPVIVAHR